MSNSSNQSKLYTLAVVFFFWGFVAASNGIFIPFCKSHFSLSQFQSQLIDFTFYGGYFIGSILLFVFSSLAKVDILNRIGYKKGIIYGLLISILGALAIIPSVQAGSFNLILASFFLIALGFSLQQTAAQPFVAALGPVETATHRLNFAGGVNSLGTTLGPLIVSYVLFGSVTNAGEASLGNINTLYLILAGVFGAVALFFSVSKLPDVTSNEAFEKVGAALKYPQLWLGMIAIFMYVGVEVTIQSNLGALLKLPDFGAMEESHISGFISLYWGSLMIGRWTGAVSAFNLSKSTKKLLTVVVPYLAFGVILLVNSLRGNDITELLPYAGCIAVLVIGFMLGQERPATSLFIFGLIGLVAMLIGLMSTGTIALYAFLSGGLACSIMWPSIFSLAVAGLGKYTSQGSSFLIMMILGGAIIPPFQGKLADMPAIGIHASYVVTLVCFGYITFYALRVRKVLKNQGINVDDVAAEGGH